MYQIKIDDYVYVSYGELKVFSLMTSILVAKDRFLLFFELYYKFIVLAFFFLVRLNF